MKWIRFLGLPGYLYKHKILEGWVGKVVKLDFNTDSRMRGRFARMTVYINLERPLVSQILINGCFQMVEYESLLTICFQCGRYGHVKDNCSFKNTEINMGKESTLPKKPSESHNMVEVGQKKGKKNYGQWMIVERRQRRKSRDNGKHS
ncbi:GroES-like zinc-binding alcohol dehydrogenase family protein [Gossypium australe]|uniref:GroES-like zinc-binding alcohol dehydrogenase family protein n=1 Tax=Gossypium australe TaxID=47621 RepID=A0A5B6URV6_9ROSI|nr:GroES-like zinc-binding alcohol dehydrogenase family protein [Gossypium australe]